MNRKLTVLLLVLLAVTPLSAQMKQRATMPPMNGGADALATMKISPAMISGTVTSVAGNIITIAGTVKVDTTDAKIVGDESKDATPAAIVTGSLVVVTPKSTEVAAGAAIPAALVAVHRVHALTLAGTVQSVDAAKQSFNVLGQTVLVNANTSFGGTRLGVPATFADIVAGAIVHVEADVTSGQLVAADVQVMSPVAMQPVTFLRGTVKTIGATAWVITTEKGDVTVGVTAQTKVVGDPKASDPVEVVAILDTAGNYVALSIVKRSTAPTTIVTVRGTVKSISATSWVIAAEGKETTVTVNASTKIETGIAVNDQVTILADNSSGSLVAVSIVKSRTSNFGTYSGTVQSTSASAWVVRTADGDKTFTVTPKTIIMPGLIVGDRVIVVADTTTTPPTAITIARSMM